MILQTKIQNIEKIYMEAYGTKNASNDKKIVKRKNTKILNMY